MANRIIASLLNEALIDALTNKLVQSLWRANTTIEAELRCEVFELTHINNDPNRSYALLRSIIECLERSCLEAQKPEHEPDRLEMHRIGQEWAKDCLAQKQERYELELKEKGLPPSDYQILCEQVEPKPIEKEPDNLNGLLVWNRDKSDLVRLIYGLCNSNALGVKGGKTNQQAVFEAFSKIFGEPTLMKPNSDIQSAMNASDDKKDKLFQALKNAISNYEIKK